MIKPLTDDSSHSTKSLTKIVLVDCSVKCNLRNHKLMQSELDAQHEKLHFHQS